MKYVKFCPYCANISWPSFTEEEFQELVNNNDAMYKLQIEYEHGYYNNVCHECKNNLMETKISVAEYTNNIGYDYNIDKYYRGVINEEKREAINKKILNDYIKPLNLLEIKSDKYLDNMLILYGINLRPQPTYTPTPTSLLMAQQIAQNKPKCPICGSTNLKKLDALDRGFSVFMLGLGSNKIGKTYQCNNCKATF